MTLRKLSDVAEVESVLNPSLSRQRFNRSDTIVEDTTACPSDRRARSAQSSHVTLDLEAQTQTIEDGKNLYDWEEQEYYDTTEENGQHNFWSPIRDRFREPLAEGLAVGKPVAILETKCYTFLSGYQFYLLATNHIHRHSPLRSLQSPPIFQS